MNEVVNIDESRIKFKVFGFFPPAGQEALGIQGALGYLKKLIPKSINIYIKRNRINEAVTKEFPIHDGVRVDILNEFAKRDENGDPVMDENRNFALPDPGTPEMAELNHKYNDLMNQDVVLPYGKFSQDDFKKIPETIEEKEWSMEVLDLLSIFIDFTEVIEEVFDGTKEESV
jgi:hypothetical protein